jgi:branched-chain amino acid aminotransferase
MASIFYMDGTFVDARQATLPVDDLAILRGYGVFDFLRTYNGVPFYLEAHVERLFHSAARIGLAMRWTEQEVVDITRQTLAKNQGTEHNLRIMVTGGTSEDDFCPSGRSRLLVMVTPHKEKPRWWYEKGVKLTTWRTERDFPEAKSTNYIAGIMALQKACATGGVEALYIGRDGQVLECTTSNIFGFMGERLVTPDTGILPGITRQVVLELAAGAFGTEKRRLSLEDLNTLDEVFITSSTREIVPVIRIDEHIVGRGGPGGRTVKLMSLFSELTRNYGKK